LGFERAKSLRRIKPQRKTGALARRTEADLPWVGPPGPGAELLLDTYVYLDVLQGKTPPEVDELLQLRIVNHSTIALAELTHLFGRLDPNHSGAERAVGDEQRDRRHPRAPVDGSCGAGFRGGGHAGRFGDAARRPGRRR
jgi:hypothetical protein